MSVGGQDVRDDYARSAHVPFMLEPRIHKPIIFGASAAFALQALLAIHFYGVQGVPIRDEWQFVHIVLSYVNGGEFWTEPRFFHYTGSLMILPHLIMLADAYLFSWSFVFQMYLGWAFLVGSLVLLYLLIRQYGDVRLEYLLIPIAAMMFSPNQYGMLLWGHASVLWTVVFLGFVSCVYCLSKLPTSRLWLMPAIASAAAITFSAAFGTAAWIIGLISLVSLARKGAGLRPMLIWIASALAVYAVFAYGYLDTPSPNQVGRGVSLLVSDHHGLAFIMSIMSNGMHLHYEALHVVLGAVMVSAIVLAVLYLYKNKAVYHKTVPFVQLFLFGLSSAAITVIGRPDADPLASHYILRGNLVAIPFLILLAAVCIMHAGTRRSRTVVIPSVMLMAVFLAGLGAAYHEGYPKILAWHEAYENSIPCMADMNNVQSHTMLCRSEVVNFKSNIGQYSGTLPEQIKMMSDAKIALYKDHPLQPRSDALLDHKDWEVFRAGADVKGGIDNPEWIKHPEGLVFNEHRLHHIGLSGWSLLDDNRTPDAVYVLVGDDIIRRATYGDFRAEVPGMTRTDGYSGWHALVDVSTLEGGDGSDGKTCHDVKVRVLDGEIYGEHETEPVCIKYNKFHTHGRIDSPADAYPDWSTGLDPDDHPAVRLSGWTVIHRNYQQPDGIMLLIGNHTYDDPITGLERADVNKRLAGRIGHDHGWEITADVTDLEPGCHDVRIRIMRGDAYVDKETEPLCIA